MNTREAAERDSGGCAAGMTLLEYFAGQALQSLIAKIPIIDREGEHGEQRTQAEIDQIRTDVAESAYYYADAMVAELQRRAALNIVLKEEPANG